MLENTGNAAPNQVFLSAGAEHLTFGQIERMAAAMYRSIAAGPALPAGPVALLIEDNALLLAATRAVVTNGLVCVPVDPATDDRWLGRVLDACGPACILAEEKFAGRLAGRRHVVIAGGDVAEAPDAPAASLHPEPFRFYADAPGGGVEARPVAAAVLAATLRQLDALTGCQEGDTLLLLAGTPFESRVIDLLWACDRGVRVVVDAAGDALNLDRYLPTADDFAMDFGLFYFGSFVEQGGGRDKYRLLMDSVQFADRNNFSSVWTPERHFNEFGGLFPNPSLMAAALAMVTDRVQIRSGSLVSPLHHAARIAEDWAVVDNLSNGRAAISFASGWQCNDFVFFPDNYEKRHEVMLEQIDTVKKLWRGEKHAFRNGLGSDVEVGIFPKPVQAELPVWMTVSGKTESFVDAGRIGANILTHLLWQDTDDLIHKIKAYRESLQQHGFNPASRTVSIMAHTYLGADNEEVRRLVKPSLMAYIKSSVHLIEAMSGSTVKNTDKKDVVGRYGTIEEQIPPHLLEQLVELAFNRFFDKAGLLGTVEKCRAMVRKLKGYGVDEIACMIDFGVDGENIMKGLPYLNALRGEYDAAAKGKFNLSLSRCPADTFRRLAADPGSRRFLSEMKSILIEGGDAEGDAGTVLPYNCRKVAFNAAADGETLFDVLAEHDPEAVLEETFCEFNSLIDKDF